MKNMLYIFYFNPTVHTGQTVNTGHFVAYLKKDSKFHQFNDGQIILERPESFVETADIFIFVAIHPDAENSLSSNQN